MKRFYLSSMSRRMSCAATAVTTSAVMVPSSAPSSSTCTSTTIVMQKRWYRMTPVQLCAAAAAAQSTTTTTSTASEGAAADAAASALDTAMRVNKLKRLHQTGGNANSNKKQLEYNAWKELNALSEDQINHAEGKAVALLLNSWAYFAKFWEKGKDGPQGAGPGNGPNDDNTVGAQDK